MRVITGTARGRKLETLDGLDVRPTTEIVKEAVFSMIHFRLPASNVADIFAGSGQMGIEAISRGAKKATFVDQSRASIEIVTAQSCLDRAGRTGKCRDGRRRIFPGTHQGKV